MVIVYVLLGIIALLLVMALFISKEMVIEKLVVIKKPKDQVFRFLKYTKNQDQFSVWNMVDPNMNKNYKGEDGQVGFVYTWDSTNKNVGAGEQETIKIEEGKSIEFEVRFFRPMKNVASVKLIVESISSDETRVQWVFNGPMKYPMNLMKSIFQNMLGKDLQKGLDNLKLLLEK